jgi:hypothetical protein
LIAAILFIPVLITYFRIGLVPNFPTLIVSGFVALAAIQSFFAGLVLTTLVAKDHRDFEFHLQLVCKMQQEMLLELKKKEKVESR